MANWIADCQNQVKIGCAALLLLLSPALLFAASFHWVDRDGFHEVDQLAKVPLEHRKEQLPQVWWGLAVSLSYQGKVQAAVAEVDRIIALYPDNAAAKQLRETILDEGTKK